MNFVEHVLNGTAETPVTHGQLPSPLGATKATEPGARRQRDRATDTPTPILILTEETPNAPTVLQSRRASGRVFKTK